MDQRSPITETDDRDATSGAEFEARLESFSFSVARDGLNRELAVTTEVAAALRTHAVAIPSLIDSSIMRSRDTLRDLEALQRKKIDNAWRTIALDVISAAENDGGSLPTFDGHTDFIDTLRTSLTQAESLAAFQAVLEAERKRWRLSLFGRKKLEVISILSSRISTETERLAARTAEAVRQTFVDRSEAARRDHDFELESIGLWYRHLLREALRRLGAIGLATRWEMIALWEDDFIRRIAARRLSPNICLEMEKTWVRFDEQITASLDSHLVAMRQEIGGTGVALLPVGDVMAAEVRHIGSRRDALEQIRTGWETLTPEIRQSLTRTISTINEATSVHRRQFAALIEHPRVQTVSDFLNAIREANHLGTDIRKRVFDAAAALEPFRALRTKIRRLDHAAKQRMEEYERFVESLTS